MAEQHTASTAARQHRQRLEWLGRVIRLARPSRPDVECRYRCLDTGQKWYSQKTAKDLKRHMCTQSEDRRQQRSDLRTSLLFCLFGDVWLILSTIFEGLPRTLHEVAQADLCHCCILPLPIFGGAGGDDARWSVLCFCIAP